MAADPVERKKLGKDMAPSAVALLDATAMLLSESTTVDVSLSEISARSGVNSAMIKYFFGNKEGLLVALLEREAQPSMDALNHLVGLELSAERKLTIHIHGIINAYFRSPYLNRLIHYLIDSGSPFASERVSEIFVKPMLAAYAAIVAQGVAEGSLRDVEPGLLYYAMVGASDHIFHANYSVPTLLGAETLDVSLKQRYAEFVGDIFLRGLRPD